MRAHNGLILVTEPVGIRQLSLTGSETELPNVPTGDLGREVKQITIRSRDVAWEWRFLDVPSDWFWMGAGEILVFPIRDLAQLTNLRLRRAAEAAGNADIRIVYEA